MKTKALVTKELCLVMPHRDRESFPELEGRFFPLAAPLSQRNSQTHLRRMLEKMAHYHGPDQMQEPSYKEYENGKPTKVHTVVIAIQHDKNLKDKFGGSEEKEQQFVRK